MTPLETLARASALIRERAESATEPPWSVKVRPHGGPHVVNVDHAEAVAKVFVNDHELANAEHIASWSPGTALAAADWLDVTARDVGTSSLAFHAALTFARSYLGES